jgi:hypothetical protein
MSATRQVWPLAEVSVAVRAPYSTTTRSATDTDWSALLREIRTLRILDGSTRYYHGILRREGAWSGLAYVGYPVGITRDGNSTWTVAHELGHNFGRRHAPCGNPSGVDAAFPQADGSIGLWGLDLEGTPQPPTRPDLMTYCSPRWVSEYNYVAALAFRQTEAERGGPRVNTVGDVPVLVVAGEVSPRGIVLDPAFAVTGQPALPARGGPHTLTGLDDAGVPLFQLAFAGEELGEGPDDVRHFAFALPVQPGELERLVELRVDAHGRSAAATSALPPAQRGQAGLLRAGDVALDATRVAPGRVRLRWEAGVLAHALVRDPATGETVARVREGDAELMTAATELEVHLSDGVTSTGRRVVVR